MDFEYHYTEEQERFRAEVSAWLEANLPQELKDAGDWSALDESVWEQSRDFQQRLGAKGWLAPTESVERSGAGLTSEHALVLIEELGKRGMRWTLEQSGNALRIALNRWGTEEQKDRYLPLLSKAQLNLWHLQMEAGADLDIGELHIEAFLDGDDYVLNGEGVFEGPGRSPDYLWALTLTDPDADPEVATATFLVPAGLEGIEITTPDTLIAGQTRLVTFDNVWVPSTCLLGEEGDGWSVLEDSLLDDPLLEYPTEPDQDVANLLKYASETTRFGKALSQQPFYQQLLMEVYVNSEIVRIFKVRNAWMASTGQELTYHRSETALAEKQAAMRLSQVVREVMGIFALLGSDDPLAPVRGRFQGHQKRSLSKQNLIPGPEVQSRAVVKNLGFDPLEAKGTLTWPEEEEEEEETGAVPSQ